MKTFVTATPLMSISPDLSASVGHTPLVRLRHASELTGCHILAKAVLVGRFRRPM